MPETIVRFSGNNLKDPLVLKSLVQILKQSNSSYSIVISSTQKIHDLLADGIEILGNATGNPILLLSEIKSEVNSILQSNSLTGFPELSELFEKLEILLKGIHYTGDYSPALQDQVVSFAERIAAAILVEYLRVNEVQATAQAPETIGLLVSEEYGNATVLLEETTTRVKAFSFGELSVIPGSFGQTKNGKIARIGDRAADYTAATLATIFDADHLELWEIGKPFKTADDSLVENPDYIESLTYAEASELSYFNYSGIHPRIVEPLIEKHIPIYVYEIASGEKVLRTKINSKSVLAPRVVKSVAHTDDIAILKLNGPGVGFKPGILAKVTSAFSQNRINIRSVITAQTSINILIDKSAVKQVKALTELLKLSSVSSIEVDDQIALVAIVGHGMQQNHGISAALFSAVAQNKINVVLSGSGASDLVSYLVVAEADKTKAIQEIHRVFFS